MDPLNPSHMDPVEQKHPNDRAHFWEMHIPHLHDAPVEVSREFPRHVHRAPTTTEVSDLPYKVVMNQEQLDAALLAGWVLNPVARDLP